MYCWYVWKEHLYTTVYHVFTPQFALISHIFCELCVIEHSEI